MQFISKRSMVLSVILLFELLKVVFNQFSGSWLYLELFRFLFNSLSLMTPALIKPKYLSLVNKIQDVESVDCVFCGVCG